MTSNSESARPSSVTNLFGLHPSSKEITEYLSILADSPDYLAVEVKSYQDVVYLNFYFLGLSFLYKPTAGYKPKSGLSFSELKSDQLILDSIDIYNIPQGSASGPRSKNTSSRTAELAFSSFPRFPLVIPLDVDEAQKRMESRLEITAQTTGKDFVQSLGEPDRKGGGAGPSTGSIGIWCEWKKQGIMIEFGGDDAKGPQAWERGKDAIWKVMTLFSPMQ